jgi:hypothetical protein
VIELGNDDLVTGAPTAAQAACKVEGQRRHVRTKRDLRGGRAEEIAQRSPGSGYGGVGLFARWVGPVRIGVMMEEVIFHRCNDRARHLGSTGSIEIGHRMVVVSADERRELLAEDRDIRGAGCYCCRYAHELQPGWRNEGSS